MRSIAIAFVIFVACSSYGEEDNKGNTVVTNDAGATVVDNLKSTPGKLECGTDVCELKSQYCCISESNKQPSYKCVPADDSACSANRVKCDEAADCPDGQLCCSSISFGKFTTTCAKSCELTQACRTDNECVNKKGCSKVSCFGLEGYQCGGTNGNPFCEQL